MIIQSIFAKGNEAAIFGIGVDNETVKPKGVWRSSPKDQNLCAAAISRLTLDSMFIISPTPRSDDSPLRALLKRQGISNVKVCAEFEPIEAQATFAALVGKLRFDASEFPGWSRIRAELKRSEQGQSVALMAFLQGVIEAEKILSKPFFTPSFTVEKQLPNTRLSGILY